MTAAVEIDQVSIVFGDKPDRALPLMDQGLSREEIEAQTGLVMGVHDCSLSVEPGEILVLMGLSGSGKSTLLRAINGLNPIARGSVRVQTEGRTVDRAKADKAEMRHLRQSQVAMVFQQFGLLPWRSVRQNVELGLELSGLNKKERKAVVDEHLQMVGLKDWSDKQISELSGGMQQRVGLARALATRAPVLLMDEPFSALDPLIRTRLQDELLTLQQQLGRTILFVSHDLDEAFKLGDRIAILEGGRLIQCGTPREIFTAPATPYVADFVAHMNPLGVLKAQDVIEVLSDEAGGSVDAETSVQEVMQRLLGGSGPLKVSQEGAVIGQVSKDSVLKKILQPSG